MTRTPRGSNRRALILAAIPLAVALALTAPGRSAWAWPGQRPGVADPIRACLHPDVPRWFAQSVRRAIRIDEGAHGGGATTSPVPDAWPRSRYVARIVCWQGGFHHRFRDRRWHGMYAMTAGEVAEVGGNVRCAVGLRCSRRAARVQQNIAGLRWIWMLYGSPKAAWRNIVRADRFTSFPQPGSNHRATKHPFRMCPVTPPVHYNDDFGEYRGVGGYHPHSGNDVIAPTGRPVRAPFNGLAVSHADDWFAGRYVMVTGARGYVKNVHLSRYGHLGYVRAGTIVGYVGETGDARDPHNHFEWHPWVVPRPLHVSPHGYARVNDAIDPFPFLNQVC